MFSSWVLGWQEVLFCFPPLSPSPLFLLLLSSLLSLKLTSCQSLIALFDHWHTLFPLSLGAPLSCNRHVLSLPAHHHSFLTQAGPLDMKASLPRLLFWSPRLLPLLLVCTLCGLPPVLAASSPPSPPALGNPINKRPAQPPQPVGQSYTSSSSTSSEVTVGALTLPTLSPTQSSQYTSTHLPLNGTTSSVATSRATPTPTSSLYILSPSSTGVSEASVPMSNQHRDLIIILSVVLGVVGILVIGAAILLIYRYRKGKSPFRGRGASPINDDEIQSWRNTGHEPKHGHSSSDPRSIITRDVSIDSIALGQAPRWTPYSPHATMTHPNLPPSALGRAPNARQGLTDETVPGDAPFVPAAKRQNSRLAKAPPGHARTKSRRSSTSAKSTRSFNGPGRIVTWYDPESAESKEMGLSGDPVSSSPGTSIWDGQSVGGLSPPPRSQLQYWDKQDDRQDDIGRAIS